MNTRSVGRPYTGRLTSDKGMNGKEERRGEGLPQGREMIVVGDPLNISLEEGKKDGFIGALIIGGGF